MSIKNVLKLRKDFIVYYWKTWHTDIICLYLRRSNYGYLEIDINLKNCFNSYILKQKTYNIKLYKTNIGYYMYKLSAIIINFFYFMIVISKIKLITNLLYYI